MIAIEVARPSGVLGEAQLGPGQAPSEVFPSVVNRVSSPNNFLGIGAQKICGGSIPSAWVAHCSKYLL